VLELARAATASASVADVSAIFVPVVSRLCTIRSSSSLLVGCSGLRANLRERFAAPSTRVRRLLGHAGVISLRAVWSPDGKRVASRRLEDGWDGALGKRALRRMNQIHGRFEIANEDCLYILSALVLEPLAVLGRWYDRLLRGNGSQRFVKTVSRAGVGFEQTSTTGYRFVESHLLGS
jgi:hypothetical protein